MRSQLPGSLNGQRYHCDVGEDHGYERPTAHDRSPSGSHRWYRPAELGLHRQLHDECGCEQLRHTGLLEQEAGIHGRQRVPMRNTRGTTPVSIIREKKAHGNPRQCIRVHAAIDLGLLGGCECRIHRLLSPRPERDRDEKEQEVSKCSHLGSGSPQMKDGQDDKHLSNTARSTYR
jgi:hypothetical protein